VWQTGDERAHERPADERAQAKAEEHQGETRRELIGAACYH
jgi:hypothetical protein